MDDHNLLSIDSTGCFSSTEVHGDQCCEKHHHDGRVSYYHQLLGAVLVNPNHKEVFLNLFQSMTGRVRMIVNVMRQKRFLKDTRREHPHMKLL